MAGFVSFLKKFGLDIVKGVTAVAGSPKVILESVEADSSDLKSLVNIIKMAEGMFAAAGAQNAGSQKLAAITPYVSGMIADIEVIGGTKLGSIVKDQPGLTEGVQEIISGFVKVLNSCGD